MKLPTWNNILKFQKDIEIQHAKLIEMFPEMVLKFYTTECVKDSQLDKQIQKYKTTDETLVPTEEHPRRHVSTLWSFFYWTWDLKDDQTYNRYMNMHVQEIPSRALAFTPNGKWRLYQVANKTGKLDLNKANWTWMYCIPLDIDKKDYDKVWYPLPLELAKYNCWKDVDPIDFIYWWFDNIRELTPDAFEWINEYFYKQIVNNISRVNITPGWFHAYIMIDPSELNDPFFAEMTGDEYSFYMKWFHSIVGSDLMLDSSRTNINDVMRLPWSLHRKFKKEEWDLVNTYLCVSCPIKGTRFDAMDEDWNEIKHVVTFGDPFTVSKDTIRYAEKWRVKLIFQQIKKRIEDPEFLKKNNRYRNEVHTKKYVESKWSKQLSISEREIWRCCTYHGLSRWKVIDNLPGWYIAFDHWYWALKFRQPSWKLEHTSWYKFKRMELMSEDDIKKSITWWMWYNDEWVEMNYCGWYVNDWFSKHNRPAWPMINFLFMYMQQFVCHPWALTSEIYDEVRNYLKKICPEIDDSLISNWTRIDNWFKRYWKPSCYVECRPDKVMCNYIKQTNTGKEVDLNWWFMVFDKWWINFIGRMMMVNEWARFISNNEEDTISMYKRDNTGSFVKDFDEYTVRYLIDVWWRTIAIAPCSYSWQFEKQLIRNNTWLHFLWTDDTCKRFFNALDAACDEQADTFEEYWLQTIWWNQGSKYWINKRTGNPYCVIWDAWICWERPDILESVDDTARDIMDWNLPDVSVNEYRSHIQKLWDQRVYEKIFISAWSCQFMNIVEDVMKANVWITLWPNLNIYWWSETGKSSLRYAIQSSFWYKSWKKYLSMQMTTPQPLIDSMLDWACMLYEEMTSKVESDQKKQEAKEIVIRGAANKETKMTWWLQAKKAVKMRSCNIYFWESSIKDDSANNRIIKVKLTKGVRNPNKDEWERELRWLQNHTIRWELYPAIMGLYQDEDKLIKRLVELKNYVTKKFENERLWDLECYWMVLYVDVFKLWTVDEYLDMLDYNVQADISNVKDITWADPLQSIESLIHWLLFRADNERSYIAYWRYDTFPDKRYNNYWENNFTTVVKIDLSTTKTAVTNYDNDVEKINELMPWFVKTINNYVYICAYWDEMINRVKVLVEEWFLEDFDFDFFVAVNSEIKSSINMMCNGKNFHNWYSNEKATMSTECPDTERIAIKKVFFSSWVQL